MIDRLVIRQELLERIVTDVNNQLPEEACGLLAGTGSQVLDVIPIENTHHSQSRYRMDARQQLAAFQYIEQRDWELLAIYHSHPAGPAHPSETDIAEAYYPEAVYLILAPDSGSFMPKGFRIYNGHVLEIPLVIEGPQ